MKRFLFSRNTKHNAMLHCSCKALFERAVASLPAPTAVHVSRRRAVSTRAAAAPTTLLHFIGIGGSGVSALAVVALSQASEKKLRDLNKLWCSPKKQQPTHRGTVFPGQT
jgi:hypothetical protein